MVLKTKKRIFQEDQRGRRVRIFVTPDGRWLTTIAYANDEKQVKVWARRQGRTYRKNYSIETLLKKDGYVELPQHFHDRHPLDAR